MELILVLSIFAIDAFACYRYITGILEHTTSPTIGTWLLFATATFLNILSIFKATDFEFWSNAFSFIEFLTCAITLSTLLVKRKDLRIKTFEKGYLAAAAAIAVFWVVSFWAMTGNAFVTNLLVQALIVAGYFPTGHNIIVNKTNKESPLSWFLFMISAFLLLWLAADRGNILSAIYAIRTIVLITVMLILMAVYPKK